MSNPKTTDINDSVTTESDSSSTKEESSDFTDWLDQEVDKLHVPDNVTDVSTAVQYMTSGKKEERRQRMVRLIDKLLQEVKKHDK